MTNLTSWIREIRGHDGFRDNLLTHTKMSGGKYYIPESEYEQFQRIYAQDFDNGVRTMTLSEIKSEHAFKMFFDVDILDTVKISDEYVRKISNVIQKVLIKYFEQSEDLTYVIATTQNKQITKKNMDGIETEYTKSGIHLIYPYLFVTTEMALQLRYSVVLELEIKLGKREIAINPWSDVIDCAPYSNGLKMCGSVKVVKCVDCNGKGQLAKNTEELKTIINYRKKAFRRKIEEGDVKFDYSNLFDLSSYECKDIELSRLIREYTDNTECYACEGTKKVLEDRYYMAEYVIQSDGSVSSYQTNLIKNSTFEAIKLTSIRCKSDDVCTVNFKKPPGTAIAPRNNMIELSDINRKLSKLPASGLYNELMNSDVFKDDVVGLISWKGETVDDESIRKEIESCVRRFDPVYRDITVKSIININSVSTKKANSFIENLTSEKCKKEIIQSYNIRVMGDGSNFCLNKADTHTSCTCYFSITPKGLKQKCFSRKDIVRDGGKSLCSTYSSGVVKLPVPLKKRLFPSDESVGDVNDINHLVKGNKCSGKDNNRVRKKKKGVNWDEAMNI